jgi:hypothetical protein
MPDYRLTGVSRSELHTEFEKRPMVLGHITLSAFMATCTEGFREESYNTQSNFPYNVKEISHVEEEQYLPNILGENTSSNKMNPHDQIITDSSLIINTILTNPYHRNMFAPHSTFLQFIPTSFWQLTILFIRQQAFA